MSDKIELSEQQLPKEIDEQFSQEIADTLQHKRSKHSLKKEIAQQFRAKESTMQMLISKKNILIIAALALLSWLFVGGLVSLF
jgi:response regulator of citrate/malate metabolism